MKSLLCFVVILGVAVAFPGPHLPEGRIVGGEEVTPHSLPYQVGFMYTVPYGQFWCGGSLIHPEWILTAAHCLEDTMSAFIFIGTHNIVDNFERGSSKQMVGRESFVIHKDYDTRLNRNDIALIHLPKALTLNDNVDLIRLPSRSEAKESLEGLDLMTSGWGRTSDSTMDMSIVLNSVWLKEVSLETCASYHPYVASTNICTSGKEGRSTCDGDSGGPLVTDYPSGRTLIGITSYGAEKCQNGSPAVFTAVAPYLDWISQQTGIEIQ